jgi:hypothetical protein
MLKETPSSLRLYFGIVSAVSLLWSVAGFMHGMGSLLVFALSLASGVFCILFGYIVVRFTALLSQNPGFIKNVLLGNLLLSIISFALVMMGGFQPSAFIRLLVAILIYVYLVKSVVRLSAEAAQQGPQP